MRFYFHISGANIAPVLALPLSGLEQCVWLNRPQFVCFGVVRLWPGTGSKSLVGMLIKWPNLRDPKNAVFHVDITVVLISVLTF